MPFRSLLLSPKLSVADVECPHCHAILHAGRKSRRTIWSGLTAGGLIAAAAAYGTYQILGWSLAASAALIAAISVFTGALLTAYAWMRDDFHFDGDRQENRRIR